MPTPVPGFDGQMPPALQCPGHRDGHLLLLRAKFKIFRPGQYAVRRKHFLDLGNQIAADGLDFDRCNHSVYCAAEGGFLRVFWIGARIYLIEWRCFYDKFRHEVIIKNNCQNSAAGVLRGAVF